MVRRILRARPPAVSGAPRSRQSRRRVQQEDDEIPEVYRGMLAEAEAREPSRPENDRPIKRRKLGELKAIPVESHPGEGQTIRPPSELNENVDRQLQTAYDSAATDESDMEWEEVEIQQAPSDVFQTAQVSKEGDETLQITLDPQNDKGKKMVSRRRPVISAVEKKLRLDVHKVHLLCLLSHVQLRNLYCNDEEVQAFLKRMLSRHIIALLNPAEGKPQFTRSTTFIDGLNQASDVFLRRFKITKPGMKRPHWANGADALKQRAESIMSNVEVILSKDDFRKQAKTLEGSRDFGAQLFCALLRSVGVEARLVCSLQPLPFSGAIKNMISLKPESQYIVNSSDDHESSTDERSCSSVSATPSRIRRLGQPQFKPPRPTQSAVRTGTRSRFQESSYPVFWVEAFNEAVQKWGPVDPLVTRSLAKPFKFEPPANDPYNNMSYVVAFEEDASARDVTRRYVKAFNAKTRKTRVESTRNGEKWWTKTLEFYEKPFPEDRDEIEISELTTKSAAEPMPRNVQDFKDHPIYALERHLRRNEVIFPKRVIGQVGSSKSGSKNQALEPVYRRSDVHTLRSADGWYRLGRDIKMGEQPLKHVRTNRSKVSEVNEDEEGGNDALEKPLYAYFQTELYKPPPVVQGRIPKNVYGNLDVYVPSMVPPGAIHVKHRDAAQAAKILGVDYADAVTGFEFKGRHGTAVFQGIVIATEFGEALKEVIHGLEDERLQAQLEAKSAETLRLWKHFLLKLRIAERVKNYAIEGEEADDEASAGLSDGDYEASENAGGFFPEPGQGTNNTRLILENQNAMEQSRAMGNGSSQSVSGTNEFLGGGFLPEEPTENTAEPESLQSNLANCPKRTADAPERLRQSQPHYTLVVVPNDNPKIETSSSFNLNVCASSHEDAQTRPNTEMIETDMSEKTTAKDLTGSSEGPIIVESSTGGDSKSASVEVLSRAPSPKSVHEEADSEVDAVSLLSQDPEDEDAIPEWLMSD